MLNRRQRRWPSIKPTVVLGWTCCVCCGTLAGEFLCIPCFKATWGVQIQKALTAYTAGEQLPPFGFASQLILSITQTVTRSKHRLFPTNLNPRSIEIHVPYPYQSASTCICLMYINIKYSVIWVIMITILTGVLGWLLVVVLFAPVRGGSLGICSVSCMLYDMVRKN